MTDHKCNECVRMTVSQDEYISILEQQIEELKEFAENIVKASADNPDEFFELKKKNEELKAQLTNLERRIYSLKIKNANLERKNEKMRVEIAEVE